MAPPFDLICLSHLRWDFVTQRPQHLLTRFARQHRVFYVEEPVFEDGLAAPALDLSPRAEGPWVAVPHLPHGLTFAEAELHQERLLRGLTREQAVREPVLWYYTPMALGFSESLLADARCVVYDCMDELSLFRFAPPALHDREELLLTRADVVFTGGQSLYEAKRDRHPNVHPFPSSVDGPHFARARALAAVSAEEPADQAAIPHPRLGFCGVVDERMDLELLAGVAETRPDWQLVVIGPVAKLDPATLPRPANIHYLGGKSYHDLPAYLAGWDVALLPFARNDATRFISPTKTPEYLAAGCPVVSTSIRDVVRPYGEQGLVRIADTPEAFVAAARAAMAEDPAARQARADAFLATLSWDATQAAMARLIDDAIETAAIRRATVPPTVLAGATA